MLLLNRQAYPLLRVCKLPFFLRWQAGTPKRPIASRLLETRGSRAWVGLGNACAPRHWASRGRAPRSGLGASVLHWIGGRHPRSSRNPNPKRSRRFQCPKFGGRWRARRPELRRRAPSRPLRLPQSSPCPLENLRTRSADRRGRASPTGAREGGLRHVVHPRRRGATCGLTGDTITTCRATHEGHPQPSRGPQRRPPPRPAQSARLRPTRVPFHSPRVPRFHQKTEGRR